MIRGSDVLALPFRVVPVVSAMFDEPLCAHRPEFGHADTPLPRREDEGGQQTHTEQQ